MKRPVLLALLCSAVAGCATVTPVRYVATGGQTYTGTVDRVHNRITADIGGRTYRGNYRISEWTRTRVELTAPGAEPLYCELWVDLRRVRGNCTDLTGSDYAVDGQ